MPPDSEIVTPSPPHLNYSPKDKANPGKLSPESGKNTQKAGVACYIQTRSNFLSIKQLIKLLEKKKRDVEQ